jgi:hypothetical protein
MTTRVPEPMRRLLLGSAAVAVLAAGVQRSGHASTAWPHRATLTGLHDRPASLRAYSLGGDLIIAVDASGQFTTAVTATPRLRALSKRDTIRARTPATFPLDLSKGPVVFLAEGHDSVRLTVGHNPFGSVEPVTAMGREFTVTLVGRRFVIDAR